MPPLLHSPRAGGPGSTCPAEPVDRRGPACWRQLTVAPVLDFTWVSACPFRLWKRLGLGPCVLPSFPCCPAPGGEGWCFAKRRDCFPVVFHPTHVRDRSFLPLTLWPCLPCCFAASSRSLQHKAPCAPSTSQGTKPLAVGRSGAKSKGKTSPFPPLSLPSPRPKTVNTVSPASCIPPVPSAPA